METLKLVEVCETHYFPNDSANLIKTVLMGTKPSVLDLTGARFTPNSIAALVEYYMLKDENGNFYCKEVIDPRELMVKHFKSVQELASFDKSVFDTPIPLPKTVEDYRNVMSQLKEESAASKKYYIEAGTATSSVVAAFYTVLQIMRPHIAVYVETQVIKEFGILIRNNIPKDYYFNECPRDKLLVIAYGICLMELDANSEGKYDLGVQGFKTFSDICKMFPIIPPELGVVNVGKNHPTYAALYEKCNAIMQKHFKDSRPAKQRDLYTILTKGV